MHGELMNITVRETEGDFKFACWIEIDIDWYVVLMKETRIKDVIEKVFGMWV